MQLQIAHPPMETKLELKSRQRIERLMASEPPISWYVMPFLILGGGLLIAAACFAMGADYVFIWPPLAVMGYAIFSYNGYVVRQRLEAIDEQHRIERLMLEGALRAKKEAESDGGRS